MIIVIGGIKGGTGKTTLATNLAVIRAIHKKNVLLIDADEQKSATDWSNQRKFAKLPLKTDLTTYSLSSHRLLEIKKEDYDDIIVDVGGRDTTSQRAALIVADVFLVPFRPRSFDIWTISTLNMMMSKIKEVNPNLKSYTVLNQADFQGKDNEEAKNIISENSLFTFLDTFICQRKAFSNASSDGLGVIELKVGNKKACREIFDLYGKIYT